MANPICIRVTEEERQLFVDASERAHKTLTRFIKDAAKQAARKVEKMEASTTHRHGGLPTYVKASIFEAASGGTRGYRDVGWKLATSLAGEVPHSADLEEWQAELDQLKDLIFPAKWRLSRKHGPAILEWFDEHYPKIMQRIPLRRREQFLEGVYEAAESEEIQLEV